MNISKKLQLLESTLRGSMRYEFNGTVLTLTQYYSGKSIKIDLGNINEEMLEELIVPDYDDDEEYDEDEED